MKSTAPDAHSAERLERIWRTSILPLLQEHHYGEWESVKRHYQLNSLLPAATSVPSGDESDDLPVEVTTGDESPPDDG
jgi:hypothetical protein